MPFISYPSAFLYAEPRLELKPRSSVEHWPWGFYVRTLGTEENGFIKVRHYRKDDDGTEHHHAWIRKNDLQDERILEVNYVDIGQGDGCFLVFPDDQRMMIDAGESDNMYRFLRWRFNRKPTHIHNAVISHPDKDHYYGFRELVNDSKFSFGNLYHNGIVERTGRASLGPRTSGRGSMLQDIIETPDQLDAILDNDSAVGGKLYPNLLKDFRDFGRTDSIWMLHHEDRFVPGYNPGEDSAGVEMQVLGPYVQRSGLRAELPWFGSTGKTKNGHSVILKLRYGNVTFLLGGDLNIKAEDYLLESYTGLDPTPTSVSEHEALVAAARNTFEADVLKACHHGSADVREVFVEAVDPLATVISSGDNEPHCHPRPDALGIYGKYARGRRPLIFSTELARSAKEFTTTPVAIQERIEALVEIVGNASSTPADKTEASEEIGRLTRRRERAIAVYGMITARTDGKKLIMTQKLERKRSSTGERWDIHKFEPGGDGRLRYVAKH